ncbi:uncharacterized protein LOC106181514 [Lingula anatina]|uniref:Uncharacterized protein LOC106181514 n=1 Tax=Lingula anatina TaxID=7574 RepID=A0A1S3KGK6_LINAN|nr:uncharacterized protein LOC106181514 [Lingula anatina]|eukprot:XP_013421366.1 uncharacterized protein LOC106181514 [Lingula anatina]
MYSKKYITVAFILLSLSRKTSGTACPTTAGETWHLEATQCYVKVEQSKNFQDAEDWCQTQSGAHLVGIEEVDENTFLSSLLTVGGSSSIKYWIGLHKNSSQWVWLDGTNSTYDNWDMTSVPSEPDGSGDCVVMAGGSFWQDIDCSTVTNGFICETVGVCPSVPTFSHAAHNSTSVIVGSAVGYVCNPGYIFSAGVTSQISVCQDSGTWLPVIADCIEMNCTAPPAVSHASIQPYTSVIVGSIVTYDCDTGYQFSLGVESMSIACNESVLWNDTLPACSLKSCPTPQTIQRGSQGTTDGLVFSTLQYTCDIGYEFTNNETTMTVACNTSALWNETLSDCRIKDCVAVPVIANGWSWSNPSTTYGSSVRFGCNFGYTFSTGDYYFYTQCDNTKQWTPAVPACITIGCTTPPLVTDAYMNYTSTGLGDQVNYTCLAGYVFPDENTTKSAVCIGNGLWDPVVPSCEKKYVQCPSIMPMSHVTVEGNGTIAYSQVTLTCDDGYRFPNDTNAVTGLKVQEIQCLYGQWNGTLMACQILSCGTVPVYNNMSVVASGQLYGDTATYTCQTNGTMFPDGSTERTVRCVDRGWSPSSLPNCQGTQTTVSVKAPVIVPVEAAVEVVVATATVPMALVGGMLGLMVFLDLATIGKHLAKMKENLMHFKYRLNNETPPVKKKKKKEEVAVVCKHCKEEGHKSRDCPICKYCKSTEHSHKDCYLLKTYCDNCGYHGHTPDECDDSDVERIKEEDEEEEEEYDDQKVKRKGKRKKSFDSGIIHDWAEWDGLMAVRDMAVACELPELPRDDFKFRRALSCPPRMKKITHQELMTTTMVVDTSFVPIPGPKDDYRPVFSPTERARNVQPAWQEYLRWDVDCQILTPAHTPLPEEIRVPTPVYRSVMTPTAVPHTLNTQRQNLDRTLFSSGDTPIPMDIAEMKIHKEIVSSPIKEVTVPLSQSVKEPPATEEVSVDLSEKLAPSATTRVHNMMFSPGETPVPQHMAEIILERKQSSPYLEGFPLQTMPEDDNLSTMTDSTIGIDEIEEELMKLAEDELEEMNRVCSQAKKSQISRHEQQNEKPQKEAGSSKETKNTATPSSVIFEDQKVRPLLSPSTSPVPPPRSKREIKSSAAKWTPADRDKPVFTPLADVDPSQTIKIKSIEQTIPETDEDKILEEKIAMSLAKHSSSPTYIKCQEQRQRQLMTPTISPVPPPRKKKDVKAALILDNRPLFTPLQMTDPSQAVSQSDFDTENIHGISDHNMEPISKPVTPTSQAVKEESIEQTIPETDEDKNL